MPRSNLLIAKRRPIEGCGWSCTALRIEYNHDHRKYLIHPLLVTIVGVLASPQEQQLRQQILRLDLVEVLKLLESSRYILFDQVFHLPNGFGHSNENCPGHNRMTNI